MNTCQYTKIRFNWLQHTYLCIERFLDKAFSSDSACRGQVYDRASSISGHLNGAYAQIQEKFPSALYISALPSPLHQTLLTKCFCKVRVSALHQTLLASLSEMRYCNGVVSAYSFLSQAVILCEAIVEISRPVARGGVRWVRTNPLFRLWKYNKVMFTRIDYIVSYDVDLSGRWTSNVAHGHVTSTTCIKISKRKW